MNITQSLRTLPEYEVNSTVHKRALDMFVDIVEPGYEIMHCPEGVAALKHIECVARTCYQSHDRTTIDSAETLVKKLIKNGHHAMLEFGCITVKFIMDRGITHELVRHRLASFAQESTRYCNYGTIGIKVIKPKEIKDGDAFECWLHAMSTSAIAYKNLLTQNLKPQIARSVLPTCTASQIVIQANLREWMHIFSLRTAVTAHPLMVDLMSSLLLDIKHAIPIIFNDVMIGGEL